MVNRSSEMKNPKTPVARTISEIKNSLRQFLHFPGNKDPGKHNDRRKHNHGYRNTIHTYYIMYIKLFKPYKIPFKNHEIMVGFSFLKVSIHKMKGHEQLHEHTHQGHNPGLLQILCKEQDKDGDNGYY
ncbi:MAG: hypothetical protein U5K51_10180 [Flavobacteriaceae bacterium]|nr:hypothetical protein [Flavobacteriaceae bacterium]